MKPLVLVTGGAGFIGSHIVELLLESGYPVRVYDALVEQVHEGAGPAFVPEDAEFVAGDVRDAEALDHALQGVEIVLHDAAEVGVGQSMYEIVRYVEANTAGTAVLLELLVNRRDKIRKLVVASSMSIYGEGAYRCEHDGVVHPRLRPGDQLARRDWAMRCPACGERVEAIPTAEEKPLIPTSVYAITKMDQELLCLSVGDAYGIPAMALRYFNAYGPRQALSNPYTGVAAIFSGRLLNGESPRVFEDGHQRRDFIHVRDVARANLLALEADVVGEAINIGTGRATSVLDVATRLAAELGREIEPEIVGKFRAGDIRDCFADVEKARNLLGFEAEIPFEDGIPELVAWVAEQQAVDRVALASAELESRGLAR